MPLEADKLIWLSDMPGLVFLLLGNKTHGVAMSLLSGFDIFISLKVNSGINVDRFLTSLLFFLAIFKTNVKTDNESVG